MYQRIIEMYQLTSCIWVILLRPQYMRLIKVDRAHSFPKYSHPKAIA